MRPVRSSRSGPALSRSGSLRTGPTTGRIRGRSSLTWGTATASTPPALPNWHWIDSRISGLIDPQGDPPLPPQANGIFGGLGLQPLFAVLWTLLGALAFPFLSDKLRFKLFNRRPPTVTTRYVPANIPPELMERYERAHRDLKKAMTDLEEIAASQGVEPNHSIRQ